MKKEDRVYSFEVHCHAEIRKCEVIEGDFKNREGQIVHYKYLELACDDDDLNRFFIKDKLLDHESLYVRGLQGTFVLQVHVEDKFQGRTTLSMKRFIPDETD